MYEKEFAKELKGIIKGEKDKGNEFIQCDSLISYLDNVIDSPSQKLSEEELQEHKNKFQIWLTTHNNVHATNLEMLKSVLESGQNALRSSFLLNGGAAIALLAFIGKLSDTHQDKIQIFAASLSIFVTGVLAITIAYGATYLSQWLYYKDTDNNKKSGVVFNIVAIFFGLSSYGFFVWGMYKAYFSFINFA